MMRLLVTCCLLVFAGCVHRTETTGQSGQKVMRPGEHIWNTRQTQLKRNGAIEQRAEHFEKLGMTPEEARATAELEYTASGN